jgi:hypothetical protein
MQTLNIPVILGPAFSGLTLKAQLIDDIGANLGDEIATGFSEPGNAGQYLFHYEEYPDNFTGGVKFLDASDNSFLVLTAINPVDFPGDLSELIHASILHSGTLSGTSGVTVFLDEDASFQNGFYDNCWIVFTEGPGAGQVRPIQNYTGNTRAVEMEFGLSTGVDNTTRFAIVPFARVGLKGTDLGNIASSVWQLSAADFTEEGWFGTLLNAIFARVASANINVINPIAANKVITIIQGDSYYAEDNRSLDFSSASWPDLTDASIKFTANAAGNSLEVAGSVITPTGNRVVRVELTSVQTGALVTGNSAYKYDVQATLANGHIATLVRGEMTVLAQHST